MLDALRRVARRGRGWRSTAALRVLVPGAGMARLAWEVSVVYVLPRLATLAPRLPGQHIDSTLDIGWLIA